MLIPSTNPLYDLQCYEGKPIFEFDRARMFRSGLLGFALHGSLSHYYYQFCEVIIFSTIPADSMLTSFVVWSADCPNNLSWFQALFPFDGWWVVPAKVAFDQTIWSAIWNSIYFTLLGFLRFESPISIFTELRDTFFPMLTVRRSAPLIHAILSTFVLETKTNSKEPFKILIMLNGNSCSVNLFNYVEAIQLFSCEISCLLLCLFFFWFHLISGAKLFLHFSTPFCTKTIYLGESLEIVHWCINMLNMYSDLSTVKCLVPKTESWSLCRNCSLRLWVVCRFLCQLWDDCTYI